MSQLQVYPVFVLLLLLSQPAISQLSVDVEGNYVVGIPYNKVRIPTAGGTQFDLAKDLDPASTFTFRGRLSYAIHDRHIVSALVAPLTIKSSGTFKRDVRYSEGYFPANTAVNATYKFNSYRLTYRYLFVYHDQLKIGAGITGKIREANITLEAEDTQADYPDLGFVPLINFYVYWKPSEQWGLLLEGDALASKQGRAEDIFGGITFDVSEAVSLKAGYRVLEGGADVTNNYNFSFINYAALGLIASF